MKLQEAHKEFVVQCYAQFMKATEIVDAFMIEFQHELHKIYAVPNESFNPKDFDKYGFPIDQSEIKEYADRNHLNASLIFISDFQDIHRAIRTKLLAAFRRLNITHSQFPEKYKALFQKTREQYFQNYRATDLAIQENIVTELSTLYEFTKELAFEKRDLKTIAQAVQILKTIATCNAINDQQQAIDITPQDTKALQDTAKTLTDQLKNETRQLAKHTEDKDA